MRKDLPQTKKAQKFREKLQDSSWSFSLKFVIMEAMQVRYSIQDIRQAYKARHTWWGCFCLNPLASRMVWLFANFTSVRPEAVCLMSLFVGLGAAWFFYLGDSQSLFIGGILALLSNLLDSTDGKLARLRGMVTTFGGYLDFAGDVIKHTLYIIVLVIGQYHQTQDFNTFYWGLGVLYIFSVKVSNENLLGRIRAFLPPPDQSGSKQSSATELFARIDQFFARHSLVPMPCGGEFLALMFIIGPLINQVMPCLIIGGGCLGLYGVAYTVLILKRTRGLTRGLAKDQQQREKIAKLVETC